MGFLDVTSLKSVPLRTDLYTTAEAIALFGDPAKGESEMRKHIVEVHTPFKLRLYSRTAAPIRDFVLFNEKCASYAEAALNLIYEHYGQKRITQLGIDVFSGDFVIRKMRNGDEWSKHSFGLASDWLDKENGLRTPLGKATFGRPEYKDLLDIWQSCGFANLGRVKNMDAMHFEFMNPERT